MMNDKELNLRFSKYREERLMRECPICSDLWHGFKEGFMQSETRIQTLEKEVKELKELNSIYSNIAEVDRLEETEKLIKENLKLRHLLVNASTLEDKIELLEFENKKLEKEVKEILGEK